MRTRALGTWCALIFMALCWAVVWPRTVPDPGVSDRGTFVSVAVRLIAGDRLYVDVWDNKDPLFYFSNASARLVGPHADIGLEMVWLAIAMVSVFAMTREMRVTGVTRLVLAFIATPIVLTGSFYLAGHTHLPGTALGLVMMAALIRRHYLGAGGVLGLAVATKVMIAPVAGLAGLLYVCSTRQWRGLWRCAAGFVVSMTAVFLALAVRGEAMAYLAVLGGNAKYADGEWLDSNLPTWLAHLQLVWSWHVGVYVAATVIALILASLWRRRDSVRAVETTALWWAAAGSLAASLAVLAFTGFWPHHAQILYLPGVLALVSVACLPVSARGAILGAVSVCAIAISGGVAPRAYVESAQQLPDTLASLGELTPLAESVLKHGTQGSVARIGSNDSGDLVGLSEWQLACPRFHQYPFDPPESFAKTAECLPSADVIMVADNADPNEGGRNWHIFVAEVEQLLSESYECELTATGRVCVRRERNQGSAPSR